MFQETQFEVEFLSNQTDDLNDALINVNNSQKLVVRVPTITAETPPKPPEMKDFAESAAECLPAASGAFDVSPLCTESVRIFEGRSRQHTHHDSLCETGTRSQRQRRKKGWLWVSSMLPNAYQMFYLSNDRYLIRIGLI